MTDRRYRPFRRVLIANRGEIAVRIIRACRDLGIETVAVFSDPDRDAAHVRLADARVGLGGASPADSYLRAEAVVEAALRTGADAIHPGYGFLSERASFARTVADAGLAFVGPPAEVIEALGEKLRARRTAREAGVPVVPGTLEPAAIDRPDQLDALQAEAARVGFPLLIKAAAGGGGRGMRRVTTPTELPAALAAGSHEASAAFGDGTVYLEREIRPARHIEVQLLGDDSGRVIALGERDCSIQRRHQKLIEEAPAPGLSREERVGLHDLAVRIGTAAGLRNAATAEFLRDRAGAFHFLEVNTRLQVEHGVTELVTGLDIVREQFWLAAGRGLSDEALEAASRAGQPTGHAIEVRIGAEDPARDFVPTPGLVTHWSMPAGPGIRVDTAIEGGERVPPEYDNLIAKVMAQGPSREGAIERLGRALSETEIAGIQTTLPFHRYVLEQASFRSGDLSTDWLADHWNGPREYERATRVALLAAGLLALEAPASASHQQAQRGGAPVGATGWRKAGLEQAVDRWPR